MSLLTSQMIRAARAVGLAAAPTLLLLTLVAGSGVNAWAQEAQPDKPKAAPDKPKPKVGLLVNEPAACKGYTLIASTNSGNTYLVDMEGASSIPGRAKSPRA